MKIGNKKSSYINNPTTKMGHSSLEKIKNILRFNDTLKNAVEKTEPTISIGGFFKTQEENAYQTEAERKKNEGRVYAGTAIFR
jgi:hypothetical protein